MAKVIGIVGSRRRDSVTDYLCCRRAFLWLYEEGDAIVSGGCPQGGDRFAEIIAKHYGLSITIHYPNWTKHGKPAGIIRNTLIARDCTILLAIVHPSRTGGTEDTVRKAKKLGKRVWYA